MFWQAKLNKIKKRFITEVANYADDLRSKKEKIGESSFEFEKKMIAFKKEIELMHYQVKKPTQKERLKWLILSIDEYILLSKQAKKTTLGSEKGRKKVEKHQKKAFEYYQLFSKK